MIWMNGWMDGLHILTWTISSPRGGIVFWEYWFTAIRQTPLSAPQYLNIVWRQLRNTQNEGILECYFDKHIWTTLAQSAKSSLAKSLQGTIQRSMAGDSWNIDKGTLPVSLAVIRKIANQTKHKEEEVTVSPLLPTLTAWSAGQLAFSQHCGQAGMTRVSHILASWWSSRAIRSGKPSNMSLLGLWGGGGLAMKNSYLEGEQCFFLLFLHLSTIHPG